jgi:hypothetical protein
MSDRALEGRRLARSVVAWSALIVLLTAADALAQEASDGNGDPPPPVPPEVVSRAENGRTVVRAVRAPEGLRIDGRLDEEIYQSVPSISGFVQTVPDEHAPATEATEAWIFYDDRNMYVSCRCWDSAPPEQWVANEMRRDNPQIRDNDTFGVSFDTFFDRRNAFVFYTNPLGGFSDQVFTDEGNPNREWNPVWSVRTGSFEGGWTVEMAIPFKALRYTSGSNQTWGVQVRRGVRRKNEWTHLSFLPAALGGSTAWFRISGSATLVGLDLPSASKNIEVKPYAISSVTTDRASGLSNDGDGNIGVDAKYGINANLTADLTVNTDFAQVEVDEQQVNLTRFALSYPEKRDFFLEGRGIFEFGRGGQNVGPGGGGANSIAPTLFYSRRIGLNAGRVIPIDVGGRVTGKVGKVGLGLLNIQTDDEVVSATPSTNFTVVRVKRDLLRRSSIGAIFTNRSESVVSRGTNQAYGVDAGFSFFENVAVGGYYARTATPSLEGDEDSYQARFDWSPDRYGARAEYLKVGDHFNPEVGLVRRDDFKRSFGLARFSPRPKSIESVRKFTWEASLENFENGAGQTETRIWNGRFNTEFQNSDQATLEVSKNYEMLVDPFPIAPGVIIPVGAYDFSDATVTYLFGQQRPASGSVSLQHGGFYDGTITAVGVSGARVAVTKQLSVEPGLSLNLVTLPHGDFTTSLVRVRTDYGFSPRMFAGALIQYNSGDNTFSSNLRFRWEYQPGSEFFIVYTDERDAEAAFGVPRLRNRAFVVKINRLWQF